MTAEHPQLLVYKASAGSGKTFTLAVQYIRQLIDDPSAYRRILAVTFTNKATAEMKSRILEQLYGIGYGLHESDGYLSVLTQLTGRDETAIRNAARTALHNILHDYSRFRIETIDSFFQSVMRNLARELELGANMRVELNDTDVLSDAVDAMIEKLDRRSPVLHRLLEYIDERMADDKRWDVSEEIKAFGRNIFSEVYAAKGEGLRRKLEDPDFLPAYRAEVTDVRRRALEEMKAHADTFQHILQDNNLTAADLKGGSRGIGSYFDKLTRGKLSDDIRNATVEKCLESADNWTTKTSARRDEIRSLAAAHLLPLLRRAEDDRTADNILVNSCNLSLRYLNNLCLLTHIDREVRTQNHLHNRFLLADTNALLHSLISHGDAAFVYEKLGTQIDTVMIDEFQDTSAMQWENFHLLLEESLAQKDGSLVVGDIKQSIYRWRNSDRKILAGLPHDPSLRVRECTLGTNWRSEAHIIHFNNALFTELCHILDQRFRADTGQPCTELTEAYSDVCQQTARSEQLGWVRVEFLTDTRQEPYVLQTLRQLSAQVNSLTSQGVELHDIAILVRKNKSIPAIASYFEEHTPYRIVSDEAFRLDSSPAVNLLIDALRSLASPQDRTSRARLALAYYRALHNPDTDTDAILGGNPEHFLPAAYVLQESELRLLPLYELLEQICLLLDVRNIAGQDAYLCAFFDAITEYAGSNSSELTGFLTYWDENLRAKTIPAGKTDGIRILSVHKSKGLEFHTVLLPFCDWKIENETNSHLIWCSVNGTGVADRPPFNRLDLVPVNYSSAMAASVYSHNYREEQLQLWLDSLNLLYVACTRARKNLVIWTRDGQRGTVAELLAEAIPAMPSGMMEASEEGETSRVWQYGVCCPSEPRREKHSDNPLCMPQKPIQVQVETLSPKIDFRQSNRSAEFISADEESSERNRYIHRGQLLHSLFASIGTADDLPAALLRLSMEGVTTPEQNREIASLAERALSHPQAQTWYDGSWQLFNECNIIYTDSSGQVQTRRPDRVMTRGQHVVVVDFKFGRKKPAHHTQVQEYMQLLAGMGYTHIEGYLWYVTAHETVPVTLTANP